MTVVTGSPNLLAELILWTTPHLVDVLNLPGKPPHSQLVTYS